MHLKIMCKYLVHWELRAIALHVNSCGHNFKELVTIKYHLNVCVLGFNYSKTMIRFLSLIKIVLT